MFGKTEKDGKKKRNYNKMKKSELYRICKEIVKNKKMIMICQNNRKIDRKKFGKRICFFASEIYLSKKYDIEEKETIHLLNELVKSRKLKIETLRNNKELHMVYTAKP